MNTRHITLGTCLRFLAIGMLIVLLVWYVLFQARNFLNGPVITLNDTASPLHHERIITLEGTARNIVKLTLNGKEIHTTEDGAFTQPLVLESGYTIMTLHAQDRFGRTTSITREFVFVPAST